MFGVQLKMGDLGFGYKFIDMTRLNGITNDSMKGNELLFGDERFSK